MQACMAHIQFFFNRSYKCNLVFYGLLHANVVTYMGLQPGWYWVRLPEPH